MKLDDIEKILDELDQKQQANLHKKLTEKVKMAKYWLQFVEKLIKKAPVIDPKRKKKGVVSKKPIPPPKETLMEA